MQLLASGRDADVFAIGEGKVLRRYRSPDRDTTREAEVMRYARDHGVLAPEVHDAAGPDLVMQRVDGLTMGAVLRSRPWLAWREAKRLAAVHHAVHAVPAPGWLQTGAQGTSLLHLDLHPENVILTADGPCVIDWTAAAAGDPALDVADTWLVLSAVELDGSVIQRRLLSPAVSYLAELFLRATGTQIASQLAAAAERRASDPNLRDVERRRIARLAARS